MLVFRFIFDLLWRDRGSSVTSLAFLGFRELKEIEKRGPKHFNYGKESDAQEHCQIVKTNINR